MSDLVGSSPLQFDWNQCLRRAVVGTPSGYELIKLYAARGEAGNDVVAVYCHVQEGQVISRVYDPSGRISEAACDLLIDLIL